MSMKIVGGCVSIMLYKFISKLYMQWQQRTLSEVLATRTAKRGKVSSKRNSRAKGEEDGPFFKKGELLGS